MTAEALLGLLLLALATWGAVSIAIEAWNFVWSWRPSEPLEDGRNPWVYRERVYEFLATVWVEPSPVDRFLMATNHLASPSSAKLTDASCNTPDPPPDVVPDRA